MTSSAAKYAKLSHIFVMDTILDMPLPTFPADNLKDIHNQIISSVSGARLLKSYLNQRIPPRDDATQLLNHDRSSDAVVMSHGVVWKVHMAVRRDHWPISEDVSQQTSIDSEGRRVILKYDDPVALEALLVWCIQNELLRHRRD